MIAFVTGQLADIEKDTIVVQNGGMGFEIQVPMSVIDRLPAIGRDVKIYTYMYVREDAIGLFGFWSKDDLKAFKMLITVSGIGPKGALGILSTLSADELYMAILSEDAKLISKAPGVGAKTAKRLIIELKDKIDLEAMVNDHPSADVSIGSLSTSSGQDEAMLALVSLGYSQSDALRAIRAVDGHETMDTEALLKQALKKIMIF